MAQKNDMWLINLATPFTLEKGTLSIDLLGHYTNYSSPDPRTEVADFTLVGSLGLTDKLNLIFKIPFSWISGRPHNFGMDDVAVNFKYKILTSEIFHLSIAPRVIVPTGDDEAFRGGGKVNFQIDLNFALQQSVWRFITNVGYGENKYITTVKEYSPSGSHFKLISSVQNHKRLHLSSGFAIDASSAMSFVFEGVLQMIPEFSDKDFYFQVGGVLRIHNSMLLKGGAGFGWPRDGRTIVDTKATLGLSYFIN
ncbi:MAG: transporter [bacterium]